MMHLSEVDWSNIVNNDVNAACVTLSDIFLSIMSFCIPKATLRARRNKL